MNANITIIRFAADDALPPSADATTGSRAPAFRPMDKTRTVLRGAHPSYTDPADKGAETAQNCALTGAGM
jgi:hypothetical protein